MKVHSQQRAVNDCYNITDRFTSMIHVGFCVSPCFESIETGITAAGRETHLMALFLSKERLILLALWKEPSTATIIIFVIIIAGMLPS